ncbi:MAG: hypothetical protein JWM18_1319 [Chloroflexi bacterium]|jgi:hypothetical protein|nr:hypothetical protein [Chloroflexota bacterium]
MKMTLVADPYNCSDADPCPKIWRSEDGRYWIQGEWPPAELLGQVMPPDHEGLVEYHPSLIGWKPEE